MTGFTHEPVMVKEVIEHLRLFKGAVVVDCTLGGGGHAGAVLEWADREGGQVKRLIGIDRDREALNAASERLSDHSTRLTVKKSAFNRLSEVLAEEGLDKVDGIFLDLGASYHQLTEGGRGFSFREDGPLDMRMDPEEGESAAELLMRLEEKELHRLIRDLGEERFAKRIARAVVKRREDKRPVETTTELRDLVDSAVSGRGKGSRIHPATRTFMALRIAVNRELEMLEEVLDEAPPLLSEGGRLVVLSYHSLEDRLVKRAFKRYEKGCVCPSDIPQCVCGKAPSLKVITRSPERPSEAEIEANPAARSAKLRAAERI